MIPSARGAGPGGQLSGGFDLTDAMVTLTSSGTATSTYTVPSHPDRASGDVEVQTIINVEPSTTTAGTPLDTAF
jgi:hypothetical protein